MEKIDNMNDIKNSLWVEKHRPDSLDGFVGNNHIVEKVKNYIKNNDVPHLLFYGKAGTGKTSLSKIITNHIDCDVLTINASDLSGVDVVRDKIKGFSSSMGFKKWKIVFLDESDYLSPNAQASLRNLMETFSTSTRFILTCNYLEKIIEPIQSRCQMFEIIPPSKKQVIKRMEEIMNIEKVKYDMGDLETLVNSSYPDIRSIIGLIQQQVVEGELNLDENSSIQLNYMDAVLSLLKSKNDSTKNLNLIRKVITDSKVKDFVPLYRFLFDNVDEFSTDNVGKTIKQISDYQYKDSFVGDKEINVISMIFEILRDK